MLPSPDLRQIYAALRQKIHLSSCPNFPGQLCSDNADLEEICRHIVDQGEKAEGWLPVCFEIPIAPDVEKYAALRVTAVLASTDYADSNPTHETVSRNLWSLGDTSSLNAPFPFDDPTEQLVAGQVGDFLPIVGSIYPDQIGFWQGEYFGLGIYMPMSYVLPSEGRLVCQVNELVAETSDGHFAKWAIWHDNYSPLYARDGHSRCGMLITIPRALIDNVATAHDRRLGWIVEFKLWKSEKDYSPLELTRQRLFFFD